MSPRCGALQLGRELDPLRLAAGELGRRLAEPQIAEADLAQHVERRGAPAARRRRTRQAASTVMREHVGDDLAAVLDLERLRVVARAVAGRAGRVDARQEEQLDHDEALALAGLAAALGDVEREPPGVVAARPRRLGRGEQLAHVIEQPGVGREVRARRAADRLLIDAHQPLDRLHPAGDPAADWRPTGARSSSSPSSSSTGTSWPSCAGDELDQHLADQARLARAGDAGHGREHAERKGDVERRRRLLRVTPRKPQPARAASRGVRARRSRSREQIARASATPRPRASPAGGPL